MPPSPTDIPRLPGLGGGGVLPIAHRGASADTPENTPAALEEALRQGCGHIEVDLQLTRDRVPVLFHDRNLSRFGQPGRQIADLTLDEVRSLPMGATFGDDDRFRKERIPSLEETLDRFGRRAFLLLEIKTREGALAWDRHVDLLRLTLRAVAAAGLGGSVAVLSFDAGLIDVCAREAPHLPRVLNVRPARTLDDELRRRLPHLSALSARVGTLTPGFGRAVGQAGCPLLVFICNSAADLRRAHAAGADGIMSDRPAWLVAALRRRRRAG